MSQRKSTLELILYKPISECQIDKNLELLEKLLAVANEFDEYDRGSTAQLLIAVAKMFCEDAEIRYLDFTLNRA